MALKLTKPMRDGATAEYWRIAPSVHYDILEQTLMTTVLLYVNEAARRANKASVPVPMLESIEGFPRALLTGKAATDALATGDPRAAFYALLKADPFFAGAEDV